MRSYFFLLLGISVVCTQRCKGVGDAGHPEYACASGTKSFSHKSVLNTAERKKNK